MIHFICHLPQKIPKFPEFREIPQNLSQGFHHYLGCHLCSSKEVSLDTGQFPCNQTKCYKSRPDVIKFRPVVVYYSFNMNELRRKNCENINMKMKNRQ